MEHAEEKEKKVQKMKKYVKLLLVALVVLVIEKVCEFVTAIFSGAAVDNDKRDCWNGF